MPIDRNTPFNEFISNSHYTLGDFSISNHDYELDFTCAPQGEKLEYYLAIDDIWYYKGAGHLMIKSHPNQNNTNNLEYISITILKN